MRRSEAVTVLAVATVLTVAGLVWLFGPFGLVGSGVVLGAVALFIADIKERP